MPFDLWEKIVAINQWGVIYGTTAAYSVMIRQGFGHIVNIASAAGLIPFPTQVAYSATKFAVVGLSQALRVEAERLGVRVSVVCPGFIETGLRQTTHYLNARPEDLLAQVPFKWFPPDKLANLILDGVARNKAVIVAPWYARLFWWAYRLSPSLMEKTVGRKAMKDFRAVRKTP